MLVVCKSCLSWKDCKFNIFASLQRQFALEQQIGNPTIKRWHYSGHSRPLSSLVAQRAVLCVYTSTYRLYILDGIFQDLLGQEYYLHSTISMLENVKIGIYISTKALKLVSIFISATKKRLFIKWTKEFNLKILGNGSILFECKHTYSSFACWTYLPGYFHIVLYLVGKQSDKI